MTSIAGSTAGVSTCLTRDLLTRDLPLSSSFSRSSGDGKTQPSGALGADDRRLVQGCARRDPAAMRELVRRYQPALSRFLGQLLGSPEDTEEVVIEVFLRVWQQAHQFQGRASFSTWFYRVASNAAYDRLRRQARERRPSASTQFFHAESRNAEVLNAETLALDRLEQEERSSRLQQALSMLRAEDRLLLVLYYTEEKDYAEIARITHCTYPVLKMRLMRARRRLSALLASGTREDQE